MDMSILMRCRADQTERQKHCILSQKFLFFNVSATQTRWLYRDNMLSPFDLDI